jgi:DNA (cytosine-5-)-methyltransferase
MRFIDLFAGLGGFHAGLSEKGHQCVFACEIEPDLRELYYFNYGIKPFDDVAQIDVTKVPQHDVICAGFPCQPFSLAGKKRGAECPKSGRLIDHVVRIVKFHHPKFILLENVPNIISIAEGTFWQYLQDSFDQCGYCLYHKIISPTDLGIPQNRKRVFIVAIRQDLDMGYFNWPMTTGLGDISLTKFLKHCNNARCLEPAKIHILAHWQRLLSKLKLEKLASVSIVAPEFGATYPIDFSTMSLDEIRQYRGAYGQDMASCKSWAEVLEKMPSYTRKSKKVANWILKSVIFSRKLYNSKTEICTRWAERLDKNNNSWQILEWRGLPSCLDIYSHLVQFRASGIRVLRSNVAPSLISMTPTQIPIIPSENRYMSVQEAAHLQNLHHLNRLPESQIKAFRALGNAVNAKIVGDIIDSINKSFLNIQ